jgi:hypothetical protein
MERATLPQLNPIIQINGSTSKDMSLPRIDFRTDDADAAHRKFTAAALTSGVALITNLSLKPPIAAIQRLFDSLQTKPSLAARIQEIPSRRTRDVAKRAKSFPATKLEILDLSVARLQKICQHDTNLVQELGQDFVDIWKFYAMIETAVLPILMRATSRAAGIDLEPRHTKLNNNLRLIDHLADDALLGPQFGEPIHAGTFALVFLDAEASGLEFEFDEDWVPVPEGINVAVSWGWCGSVLSKGRVKTAKHRVLKCPDGRRTSAIISVAPSLSAMLMPMERPRSCLEHTDKRKIRVEDFEEVALRKRRRRDWSEESEDTLTVRRI